MNKYVSLFLIKQLFRFGIVGIVAAIVHFSVVIFLVQNFHYVPLKANIFGFMGGLLFSYSGHRFWTFRHTATAHASAFPKLALLQGFMLIANESLFYVFIRLGLQYPIALLLVLSILPFFTFYCSKRWVFN